MKHLFVSYELALALKEKGFDEPCIACYLPAPDWVKIKTPWLRGHCINEFKQYFNSKLKSENVAAPVYQQVIDWFREKHNLHVYTEGDNNNSMFKFDGYMGVVIKTTWKNVDEDIIKYEDKDVKPYYESLTKAIEEALKLI